MSEFKPEEFMLEPSEDLFERLRKDDLIALGRYLEIDLRSSLRKRDIQELVKQQLIRNGTFELSVSEAPNIIENENNENSLDRQQQWQREQEERQWQREQEERQWQREREEREFRIREQEIELKKLELEAARCNDSYRTDKDYFDFTKHIRMVPSFQEQEADKYFLHFEKVAKNCAWPKKYWTLLLQSVLVGKARDI